MLQGMKELMEKTVTTTDKKVLDAAERCPVVKRTLKTLFPEVFLPQKTEGIIYVCVYDDLSVLVTDDPEVADRRLCGAVHKIDLKRKTYYGEGFERELIKGKLR